MITKREVIKALFAVKGRPGHKPRHGDYVNLNNWIEILLNVLSEEERARVQELMR